MSPLLGVAIIHHRVPDLLEICLERLERYYPRCPVVVVDTAPDSTFLARLQDRYREIDILRVANHSYAAAVNAGLRHLDTPLIAQMNADVFVEAETFAHLKRPFGDPGVAMTGPLFVTGQGRRQHHGPLYRLNYLRLQPNGQLPVSWLSGALQLVRSSAVGSVGGMDSSLRFYNDDIEWCFRLRQAGFRCLLVSTEVTHLGGSSTPDSARFLVEGYRGGMRISQRYRPPWFRCLHQLAVRGEAQLRATIAVRGETRSTYRTIGTMFRTRRFDQSPFGSILDRGN